jgi:hypothetical protein
MAWLWQGIPEGSEEKVAQKYYTEERGVFQGGIPQVGCPH